LRSVKHGKHDNVGDVTKLVVHRIFYTNLVLTVFSWFLYTQI